MSRPVVMIESQTKIENVDKFNDEEENFGYANELITSFVVSMTLNAAIQLEVFQIIDKAGPDAKLSPSEIAARMPNNNPKAAEQLDRILRLLASHSVLSCSVFGSERLYGLAPTARYFIPNEDGVSLSPLSTFILDKFFLDSWCQLKDSVLEGGVPLERTHGGKAFECLGKDPNLNQVFNTAMFNHTTMAMKKILEVYNGLDNVKQLVDVAGGVGVNLKMITSKYPSLKGINFDLPHVIDQALPHHGLEHVGGSMFETIPKGDAIFLKWILHNWSDEHCLTLLKNCYSAIPDDGKVIVVEVVLPTMPETSAVEKHKTHLDMIMMVQFQGGKQRTQEDFIALAKSAGFSHVKFVSFVCNLCIMEFYK